MGVSGFVKLTLARDGSDLVVSLRDVLAVFQLPSGGGEIWWRSGDTDATCISESPSEVFRLIREAEGFVVGSESVPLVEGAE